MNDGRFAYRKQLEQLRSKLAENRPSPFKHETAKEQLTRQEGLMRRMPLMKEEERGDLESVTLDKGGIGLALAEALRGDMELPEYMEGSSPRPVLKPYELPAGDSRNDFISKLEFSESSGNTGASRTNKDGRTFVGAGQFGKARLQDYKKATGEKFTQQQFKNNPKLQRKVMDWHIRSIDQAIAETEGAGKWDRDGLRAVAHLGGITGMKQFVETNGKYNPKDEEGTSLFNYYHKFSNKKPTS